MLLCVILVLLTAATGMLAILAGRGQLPSVAALERLTIPPRQQSDPASQSATPGGQEAPQGDPQAQEPRTVRKPDEMRAAVLIPGGYPQADLNPDAMKNRIDTQLAAAQQMTMNTAVICATGPGGAFFSSRAMPNLLLETQFDPIAYAIDAAKALGMYTYLVYDLTGTADLSGKVPAALGQVDASLIDSVAADAALLAQNYHPDGVLLDGYYNLSDDQSYLRYLREGGGVGFSHYMGSIPRTLVTVVREKFAAAAPSVQLGLMSEAVWANDYENETGSATKASFCALTEGNADTLGFLESGMADFIAVKAFGSLDDPQTPYRAVAEWWANVAVQNAVPLYIVHAANKAATDAVGWSEYDQLARQVIDARELHGYEGSIFSPVDCLIENPKDCAGKLVGYFEGTVKPEHIMQDLELTKPARTTFTSFDPTVLFTGNTDPNTDATINGVEIKTDANGYFQLEMDLVEGENTFEIVHKGKTVTYHITRVTEVVREVSPADGVLNADGSTKLTITAVAYAQAKVYAVLNGTTVAMQPADTQDDEYRDTAYSRFSGVYTVPDATTAVQNLGAIVVYGEWDGLKKSRTGATVKVNVKALPSDGKPVVAVSDWAETFPSSTLSHYSDPTYLPLPKGALDYAVGSEIRYTITEENELKTFSFYRLQSGLRVLTEDIATVGTGPSGNKITGCTVTSDQRHTKVILASKQQVSYTARYSADAVTVQFHYTESLPEGMKLTKNPLFSQVAFKGDMMILTLKNKGKFMGYAAYYDDQGNLVLRFNNPPDVSGKDLTGSKIVIDPGHGGNDPGALGYLAAYPEKVINYAVASKLSKILSSRGAKVVLLNTYYNNLTLKERVRQTVEADPHLFVSVHANSSAYSPTAAGSEAYYFGSYSSAFAQYASANLAKALGTANRGGKFGYYYVTRNMQYPSILVETGFVSNRTEYARLIDDSYQNNLAYAIADAISSYFAYMGTAGTVTGTQSSGSAVQETGGATQTPQAQSASSSSGGLTLSDTALTLSVDEETQLWAEWDFGEGDEIEWSAAGDPDCVELKSDGEMMEIVAVNPGRVTITAKVKGNASAQASCVVTVEE